MTINATDTRISIFGLGYVGVVTAACFAQRGHTVIGVDVNGDKVDLLNQGRSPIVEHGIDALICEQYRAGRLSATTDAHAAVLASDLSIVCVGTPSMADGALNTQYIEAVSDDIGRALAAKTEYHVVVMRSTVLPGMTRRTIVPILERASGKTVGQDFGVCFNPEFLREATAIDDFNRPSRTVIGQYDDASGDPVFGLYHDLPAPIVRTTIETAETVKYADNVWHALKISYANEIGTLCKALAIDSHELMAMFCQDVKLNLSASYLKPGFIFGGSCLPKDLRALVGLARREGVATPVINAIMASNDAHLERAVEIVRGASVKKLGILGVTFKAGTDDVRESPSVRLIRILRDEGFDLCVHDEHLSLARVMGDNRRFLLDSIPDYASLEVPDLQALSDSVDGFIVTQNTSAYRNVVRERRKGQIVIDLVHLDGHGSQHDYHVLC